jgi:hypothetical protein
MTPQLISVQGFAFRGSRSLRLALQSTARRNKTNETYASHQKKRTTNQKF